MESNRLIEIDILRAVAILLIVASHLRYAIPAIANSEIGLSAEAILAICGLCLFFFISGYSLMLKKPAFKGVDDLKSYLAKRIIRIYPLYWLALLAIIIMRIPFGPQPFIGWDLLDLDNVQKIIVLAGMQILFVPSLFSDATLWFVSTIMIFYLVFPLLIYFSDRIKMRSGQSIFIVALIVFILLGLIKVAFSTIDKQVFFYFWFFVFGMIIKVKGIDFSNIRKSLLAAGVFLPAVGLAIMTAVHWTGIAVPYNVNWAIYLTLIGTFSISATVLFTNSFKRHMNSQAQRFIRRIAMSTYSIYLFSAYFLYAIELLADSISLIIVPFLVVMIGIPLGVLVPIYIQRATDWTISSFMNWIKRRKAIRPE